LNWLLTVRAAAVAATLAWAPLHSAENAEADPSAKPHFQEVLRLLRTNLQGVTEEDLNQAMLDGLVNRFHPRVRLLHRTHSAAAEGMPTSIRRVDVYQGFGYIGIRKVDESLPGELTAALDKLQHTNSLPGLVLDLRAAEGEDYRAAATVAGTFSSPDQVLLSWDEVDLRSPSTTALTLPVAVLVNSRTEGAAEALAGALQNAGGAVVLGARTAGLAFATRTFPLPGGYELTIASAPVRVGTDRSLESGVQPDLESAEPVDQEQAWLEDPYRLPDRGDPVQAGGAARTRFDEAELVRRHAAGTNPPFSLPPPNPQAIPTRLLQDRGLIRALDLLKGVTRVRRVAADGEF
jgi:hypothetical protein